MNEIASSSTFTSTPPAAQPAPLAPTPCPFCGSADIDVREGSTFRWRVAECDGCGAIGPEIRIQTMGDGTHEQWEADARERAFKDWNSRAPDPSRAALVAALRAAEGEMEQLRNIIKQLLPLAESGRAFATAAVFESAKAMISDARIAIAHKFTALADAAGKEGQR